ncbi:MAG: chemotaxis protein [Burkholderiales bacterium PBB2]|nr:MAG: chemotaxis protein [Burkholderiales bacterium PBB2]
MRSNLPISQQEFPFPSGRTLVSTTDLKGRILHCNAAFIEVSGYSRDELLGQPHNLIRHPDMPEEAFRDLWDTVARGLPWSGLVKNRRKNGDHYWVMANVTPLSEGGRPVAYLSVRTQPSRDQVQAADALYATMRSEAARGHLLHVLHEGQVLRQDGRSRLLRALRPGPWLPAGLGGLLLLGLGLAAGLWGAGPSSAWFLPQLLLLAALALGLTRWAWGLDRAGLQRLLAYAHQLSAGDLSQGLKPASGLNRNGDLQALEAALNQLRVNLRALVADTLDELRDMAHLSREIAQGNADLAQRTGAQAASLEQTAAAMEQITGTVRSSTDSAHQASSVAEELSRVSGQSGAVVHHVTDTMGGIAGASRRIGEIIQVIDSIAFQTNILALNAAVESARAGEHGRGFAVVASEVRALAQRSQQAAGEIRQLIHDSAEKVEAGERQTRSAQDSIEQTLQSVQHFTRLIGQIHLGADEQLRGISQVNQAIGHLDGITQQNSALVEQLARAAGVLQAQVGEVEAAVQIFRLQGGGSRSLPDAVALRRASRPPQDG